MTKLMAALLLAGAMGPLHADAIDDYVNAEMARSRTPGLALAIMKHGTLVRAQGYGFANLEHRVPVHPDTVFQSGSIGKQFTAVAAMLMVEEGKLRLDESIRTYLPDSPRWWAPITVRHLLTHTSGLASDPDINLRGDYTEDSLLATIYKQPQNFPAGQRWSYSNAGYAVLGVIIGKVAGQFYANVLKQRVFAPLGMDTARLIDERSIIPNRAAGYEVEKDGVYNQAWVSPSVNTTADGSLYLTVLDYAKWDAALRAGKILEPGSWAEIAKPVRLNSGKTYPYGFGWRLENFAGQEVRSHSGSWQGFTTHIVRYLGDEITVVALTNSDSGNPGKIARHVAGLYAPALAPPPGEPIQDDPALTQRLRSLLERTAAGTIEHTDVGRSSSEEFDELKARVRKDLEALGPLGAIKLFANRELGDEREYLYRARYEKGLIEVTMSLGASGKITSFFLRPISDWAEPVSD